MWAVSETPYFQDHGSAHSVPEPPIFYFAAAYRYHFKSQVPPPPSGFVKSLSKFLHFFLERKEPEENDKILKGSRQTSFKNTHW